MKHRMPRLILILSTTLCMSTLPSSVALDYAGEACKNAPLSECVDALIVANRNNYGRDHMFVVRVFQGYLREF